MDPALAALPPTASAAAQSSNSSDSPAGIHCANPECRTRAGERSRGHQSCRSLLCGHCCQNAARAAAEAGEQRPVCKVHARRVHTGHKPVPKEQHAEVSDPPAPVTNANANAHASTSNAVNAVAWSAPRSGDSEELSSLLEKRARLEQSLKRSLTMVVWYRNGCEPLRIAHEVSTFPLFQLQDFPELVNELGLQSSSYIDSYNSETGQWEQHKISTVRTVEQEQRLLYRLRPSLLDSLTDCPSLDQELGLQPPPMALLTKRQGEPFTPPPSSGKQARVLSNPNPVRAPAVPTPAQNTVVQNWDAPVRDASPNLGTPTWTVTASAGTALPNVRASPSTNAPIASSASTTPQTPSTANNTNMTASVTSTSNNNTKRWPTDYTVHEITEGFDNMTALIKADPSLRQKTAFERVFPPCRYVKSTVGRAKLYWKRASSEIRDHFLALGREDPRARWTHFVHLMDGRLVIEVGKEKSIVPVGPTGQGAGAAAALGVGIAEGDNDTADEEEPNASPVSFGQTQTNQPQINIQSPPGIPAHTSLPLNTRPPHMGALLPNPSPLSHHSNAPAAMSMPTSFTLDRNMNINRSSSSLSGAITISDHV